MRWIGTLGLACDLIGASLLAYGLVVGRQKAIALETSHYAESVDESTPAVADRLRQSRSTLVGLSLLVFGFSLQFVATWPGVAQQPEHLANPLAVGHVLGLWLSGIGLTLGLVAAVLLLRSLFITDEEIARLSTLPLGESGTNLTIKGDHTPRPVALVIADAAEEYTARFIAARKDERTRGRRALGLLVAAFVLQLAGLILAVALSS